MHTSPFTLDTDEQLILMVRKHWFLVFLDFFFVVLLFVLPWVVVGIAPALLTGSAQSFTLLALSAWTLTCIMSTATIWTNYYLDLWLVTNKRIMVYNQQSLFRRQETTMRMERIQDSTIEMRGIFATFFNFGDLSVNTAGDDKKNHTFQGIPDPEHVKAVVMEYVDMVTEHKNKLEYSDVEIPTVGV